jgi:hypothetical protein
MLSLRQKPGCAPFTRVPLVLTILLATMAAFPAVVFAAPEEGESPPPQPQLSFDPESYDFGLLEVDRGGDQANLQLSNEGAGEVHVDTMEIAGPGAEAFWLGFDNCGGQTLQPGQSCWVGVDFNPHATAGYSAQLRANAGGYQFDADLSGAGGRAEVGAAFNPTDFGVAKVGSAGVTREVTVTNSGNLPAGFFIAVISGGAVGSFQLLDENCTGHLLMPSASCTLQVRFQPVSAGVKTAMLSLFGDQDGGAQIALTGVGATSEPLAAPPSAAGGAQGPAAGPPARPRRHRPRGHRRRGRVGIDNGRVLTRAR